MKLVMGICEIAKGGEGISYVIITGILILALYYDLRTFKIPNFICMTGCLVGIAYMYIEQGMAGVWKSLVGIMLPFLLLFIFFCVRVIGAGDIKLLSTIGAFISKDILWVMLISFILAAIYGILLYLRRLLVLLHKKVQGEISVLQIRTIVNGYTRIHFSIPIAVGTFMVFIVI